MITKKIGNSSKIKHIYKEFSSESAFLDYLW